MQIGIILVQGFCLLKIKLTQFPGEFHLEIAIDLSLDLAKTTHAQLQIRDRKPSEKETSMIR